MGARKQRKDDAKRKRDFRDQLVDDAKDEKMKKTTAEKNIKKGD